VPFVVIQMVGVALCIIFPTLVLWLPRHWGFLQ
jgi:TRAP-type mannitol/chloroaromatic compound transport system permease large subunit